MRIGKQGKVVASEWAERWCRAAGIPESKAKLLDFAYIKGMKEAAKMAEPHHIETIDEFTSPHDRTLITGRIDGQRMVGRRIRAAVEAQKAGKG